MLLWEKEKVLKVKWAKQPDSYTSSNGFTPIGFYSDYEIKDGKFYGVGDPNHYFGYGTYYMFDSGADKIKKLVYVKSEDADVDGGIELYYFDVYIGSLAWEYI